MKRRRTRLNSNLNQIVANIDLTQVREEQLNGRTHMVAPVVIAVEGVMNGYLYPADELVKFVQAWNGRPVTLFHPKDEAGTFISANSPQVLEKVQLGQVHNSVAEDVKLKAEIWVDVEKTKAVRPEVLEYLGGGKDKLEVSTGLWGDILQVPGTWNGVEYKGIMTNIRPDHLALLPGGQGACSWEDGCGLRANEDDEEIEVQGNPYHDKSTGQFTGPGAGGGKGKSSGGKESSGSSGKGDSGGSSGGSSGSGGAKKSSAGKEPSAGTSQYHSKIADEHHAKATELFKEAYVPGRGLVFKSKEKMEAWKKHTEMSNEHNRKAVDLKERERDITSTMREIDRDQRKASPRFTKNGMEVNITDRELRRSIQTALDSMDVRSSMKQTSHYVEEIDLSKKQVIYEQSTRTVGPDGNTMGYEDKLYRRSYTLENGEAKLGDDAVEVRRVVSYQEVKTNQSEGATTVTKEEKVNALIACQRCRYEEKDREFLMGLNEDQLDLVSPPENVIVKPEPPPAANQDQKPEDKKGSEREPHGNVSAQEFISNSDMPQEVKDTLAESLAYRTFMRNELIETIGKSPKNKFAPERLQAMSTEDLRNLATLAEQPEAPKPESTSNFGMRLFGNTTPEDKGPEPLQVQSLTEIFANKDK